jgi:dTDP-4-dehydrorhamnose reductase
MRILLLGGTGQVGKEILGLARPGEVEIVAPSRSVLDLCDAQALAQTIAAHPWNAVINAAAYTDVDRAESQEMLAFAVNAAGPQRLAVETARRKIPLIHISTDYVFDGRKGAPYVEEDGVGPLNAYGRSKLAGEKAVRSANPRHVIVRTSWVYSPYGKNFVRTVLRLAAERDRLAIVADQRGCPTAARDIGAVCLEIAVRCASDNGAGPFGTYHFAGAGEATWFEFATAIVGAAAGRLARAPEIVPIRTIDYPTPALRPADTRLDCSRIVRDYAVRLRPWRDALDETIHRLLADKVNP